MTLYVFEVTEESLSMFFLRSDAHILTNSLAHTPTTFRRGEERKREKRDLLQYTGAHMGRPTQP